MRKCRPLEVKVIGAGLQQVELIYQTKAVDHSFSRWIIAKFRLQIKEILKSFGLPCVARPGLTPPPSPPPAPQH